MLVSGAFSSQRSDVGLKHKTSLEHLPGKETVQCSQHRKRAGIKRGRPRGDEGSGAMPAFENAHCGQEANASAEAGPADLELAGQLTVSTEPVAGVELSAADQSA